MKVAIHGKTLSSETLEKIENLFKKLYEKKIDILISDKFFDTLSNNGMDLGGTQIYKPGTSLDDVDFFMSFGGDGTLLQSITHIGKSEIPVLGINTGRLGFLASTTLEESELSLEDFLNDSYQLDNRMLIKAECEEDVFEGTCFGLNEFAILKQDTSSMITVHTYLDGDYLTSYWADGLIVSTPTGSTGYSLSCGGPIIYPQSHSFIITPVSPHNLNIRPIVVSDKSVITLEVESRSKYFLVSLDSRSRTVSSGLKFTIKKNDFQARLIKTGRHTFIDTLRKKLNWGLDVRN